MKLPLRYNVRSVLQRRTRSLLTAGGIAVAVFLSVMMIALSRGLIACTSGSASPMNVVVLSRGAESMEFSAIDPSVLHVVEGRYTIASPEAYISTFLRLQNDRGPGDRRGVVRGVRSIAWEVHEQARIVEGSPPRRGFEIAVGRLAATKLGVSRDELAIGTWIEFEGQRWKVVGRFDAPGTIFESEIWADLEDVLVASKRTDYSAVTIRTRDASEAKELVFDLSMRTDVRVESRTESAYYAAMAEALAPVSAVSVAMTALLVLGGAMAGMNTMFTSILGRTREMAVLLVLGYRRSAVLASFVLESVLLSVAGGVTGCAAGAALNDLPMRVPMGAFRFAVDATTLGIGLALSVAIGVFGAMIPVLRVARMQAVEGLRSE